MFYVRLLAQKVLFLELLSVLPCDVAQCDDTLYVPRLKVTAGGQSAVSDDTISYTDELQIVSVNGCPNDDANRTLECPTDGNVTLMISGQGFGEYIVRVIEFLMYSQSLKNNASVRSLARDTLRWSLRLCLLFFHKTL